MNVVHSPVLISLVQPSMSMPSWPSITRYSSTQPPLDGAVQQTVICMLSGTHLSLELDDAAWQPPLEHLYHFRGPGVCQLY